MKVLFANKRQYTNKDVLDDRYGRLWEFPTGLARRGHDVRAELLSYSGANASPQTVAGVAWRSMEAGRLKLPGFLPYIRRLRAVVVDWRPEVLICSSDSLFILAGCVASYGTGTRVVGELYDNYEAFASARLPGVSKAFARALRRVDGVVAVSEPLADRVTGDYGATCPVRTITNGLNRAAFTQRDSVAARVRLGLPPERTLIGTGGSLFANRNISVLYDAFEVIREARPDALLVVAGERDVPVPRSQAVIDLGALDYASMPDLFSALDIGVICNTPSAFGSYCFPQKAGEMAACGLPFCAADVGALSRMFRGRGHLLFKADDARSLADAVLRQADLRDVPSDLVKSWDELTADLEGFIMEIAEPRQRGSDKDSTVSVHAG